MAIELVTQFSSYVDEQFSTESKKSMLTNQDFGWDGAHSVKIYKATTAKMNDYDRAGTGANASRYGKIESVSATTEEMMLKRDRSFTARHRCTGRERDQGCSWFCHHVGPSDPRSRDSGS